jgi:hypothetical protein
MTKYMCNHCLEEIEINFPPHEANYYQINTEGVGENHWYCKECMVKIAHFTIDIL